MLHSTVDICVLTVTALLKTSTESVLIKLHNEKNLEANYVSYRENPFAVKFKFTTNITLHCKMYVFQISHQADFCYRKAVLVGAHN